MKQALYLYLVIITFAISGCTQYAYFQSPLHTNTASYKTIPLKSDSVKLSVYMSGVFSTGGANDRQRDGFNAFLGSIYRAHNFGHFQGFYGLTGSLGAYHVKSYGYTPSTNPNALRYYGNYNLNDSLISVRSGGKFFGSYGITGGISFVLPFASGGEWRALGMEVNWQREFGNYLDFRTSLPDTAANLVDRHNNFLTLAITTELIARIKDGTIGYKSAVVFAPRTLTQYDKDRRSFPRTSGYWSHTFQLTKFRVTGFTQINFGTYAVDWQLGFNYRL